MVTLADTSGLNQGDEIVVDLLNGTIEDITTGKMYQGSKLPEHVLSIVEDGGLKNHLKKTLKKGVNEPAQAKNACARTSV